MNIASLLVGGAEMALRRQFSGKNFLVTGATGGNGGAMTRRLLELGACVVATARSRQKMMELQRWAQVLGHDGRLHVCFADFARPEEISRLAQFVRQTFGEGQLDGVFHLGGMTVIKMKPAAEEIAHFEQCDLYGPRQLVAELTSDLRRGAIVAINTSVAMYFREAQVIRDYIRVKAEVADWSRRLRAELSGMGVRVMLIRMGFIGTEIWHRPEHRTRPVAQLLGKRFSESPRRAMEKVLVALLRGEDEPFVGRMAITFTVISRSPAGEPMARFVDWGTVRLLQGGPPS